MYNNILNAELKKFGHGQYTSPIFGTIDISDGVFSGDKVELCVYLEDLPEEDMMPLVEHHHEIAKMLLQPFSTKGFSYDNLQFTIISGDVLQADFYGITPTSSDTAMRIYFNNANKLATVCVIAEIPHEYRRTWRMPITEVNPADLLCVFMRELEELSQTHENIVETVSNTEATVGNKLGADVCTEVSWKAVKTCAKEAKVIVELSVGQWRNKMVVAMSEINNLQIEPIIESFYSDKG